MTTVLDSSGVFVLFFKRNGEEIKEEKEPDHQNRVRNDQGFHLPSRIISLKVYQTGVLDFKDSSSLL